MTVTLNPSPSQARPQARRLQDRIPLSGVLAAVSLVTWFIGAKLTDPSKFDLLGMIDGLNPLCWAGLALLALALLVELLRSPVTAWRGYLLTVLLVIETYALQPLVEGEARLPVAWLHAGFTNYIAEHGDILHGYDARFSWPGFFSLGAMITKAAGLESATSLLRWAPVVMMLGWVIPLGLIGRALRLPPRTIWVALWIFMAGDWVEQEYYAPQSTALILFFCAVALATRLLCRRLVQGNDYGEPQLGATLDAHRPVARAAAIGILVVIVAAMAPTHQLTPYLLAGVLFLLAVLAGLRPRGLVVLAAVVPLTWLVLGAYDFWSGHLELFTQDVGAVNSVVDNNLTQRLAGSSERQVVQAVRLGLVGIIGLLAGIGTLRLWFSSRRRTAVLIVVMAGSPASFVLVQSYGGEMFLRVWLFALPWAAMLAACALMPPATPATSPARQRALHTRWRPVVATAVVVLLVSSIGLVARSANDGFTRATTHQIAVMRQFYATVTPGTRLTQLSSYLVGGFEKMGDVTYTEVMGTCVDTEAIANCVIGTDPDTVIITEQQEIYGRLTQGYPTGWTDTVIDQLLDTVRFTTVSRDDEITVLKARTPTVLAIGDSTTLGDADPKAGETGSRAWPSMASDTLEQGGTPVRMVNAGADDEKTSDMRKRLGALLTSEKPDAVVIYGGTDDVFQSRPTKDSMADTRAMIEQVKAAGATPILVTVPPNSDRTTAPVYNTALTKLGTETGTPVVDVHSLLAASDGSWRQSDLTTDGIHPSTAGAQIIAGAISNEIKKQTGSSATSPTGPNHVNPVS